MNISDGFQCKYIYRLILRYQDDFQIVLRYYGMILESTQNLDAHKKCFYVYWLRW